MPLYPAFSSPLITGLVLPGWVPGMLICFFRSLPPGELTSIVMWAMGSSLFLAAAWLRALTASGMLSAWAMGIFIFLAWGWTWTWPMIALFILSSALTRIKHRSTHPLDAGRRNLVQVFANGGIPLLVATAYGLWPIDGLYLIFLAALAGTTADTWGTEISSWSRCNPVPSSPGSPSEPGIPGGVTLLGTIGSLLGAAALGWVGYWLQPAGVGFRGWLDNNRVNLACSLSGAALG